MMSHPKSRTRIICTIGPASESLSILKKMALAGMDVARLNFSHGSHEEHGRRIAFLRKLRRPAGTRVKILQDLEGYRIRIGKLPRGCPILLKKGKTIFFTNDWSAPRGRMIPFDYQGSLSDIKSGFHIFIDDGNLALVVCSSTSRVLRATVTQPGLLKERKGINIPEFNAPFKGLTEKDRSDVQFGLTHGVDYIAQSFVRSKADILDLRCALGRSVASIKIIAKIENRQGIRHLDEIMDVADGIMIARGDMGVSVPIYEIPVIQKMIIRQCNRRKKFVITATQMLESMTEHLRPTRAEVTDVANAILDGSDFVMLSGETAAGAYPVQTVQMMSQIARYTEKHARRF